MVSRLDDLFTTISTWYADPDLQAFRIALGVVRSHFLPLRKPIWMFMIAPPGSGKTSIMIQAMAGLPRSLVISDLTTNTFLSAQVGTTQPGLLEQLGPQHEVWNDFGQLEYITHGDALFLIKDFTTVLSWPPDKRADIVGQFREIADGSYSKRSGGTKAKLWKGHITALAAVTPDLDRFYSMFATLGERFMCVRWDRPGVEAGIKTQEQQNHETEIKYALQSQTREIFADVIVDEGDKTPEIGSPETTPELLIRNANLAELIAKTRTRCRWEGSGDNKIIVYVPPPESCTRLSDGFLATEKGIASLEHHTHIRHTEYLDVIRLAFDCLLPAKKLILQNAILGVKDQIPDSVVHHATKRFKAREMVALGVLKDAAEPYELTDEAQELSDHAVLSEVLA